MMLGETGDGAPDGLSFTIVVVNNAASGYVKALQHLMYGAGAYHASDLAETDYAAVAQAMGCTGIRVEEPGALGPALERALATAGPVILDVVVTRDPAKMLPAADNRAVQVKPGDRVA
jgi:acetolactate synthase-1/2/3 large subunit